MARTRNIKPGFFLNERIAELAPLVRLFFIGLWTVADFRGVVEWRPKRLKAQLAPYDKGNLETWLGDLRRAGCVEEFSVKGNKYLKIKNFIKHQHPHKQEVEAGTEHPDIDDADSEGDMNNIGSKAEVISPQTIILKPQTNKGDEASPTLATPAEIDPIEEQIWKNGVSLLTRSGLKEPMARSFLGSQVKHYSRERVGEAVGAALAINSPDPKAYIIGVLQKRGNASAQVGKSDYKPKDYKCTECFDTGKIHVDTPVETRVFEGQMDEVPCACQNV